MAVAHKHYCPSCKKMHGDCTVTHAPGDKYEHELHCRACFECLPLEERKRLIIEAAENQLKYIH